MTEELRWDRGGDEDAAQKPQELQVCLRGKVIYKNIATRKK